MEIMNCANYVVCVDINMKSIVGQNEMMINGKLLKIDYSMKGN